MATKKVTPITAAPSAGKAKAAAPAKTSTAVAVKRSSNVVDIRAQLQAQAAAVSDKTAPAAGNAIRMTQDKKFILPDGTQTPGPIQLVVVDFCSQNKFWEESFDAKDIKPVACFAIGSDPRKMVPSDNAPLVQSTDCNACPNNQFGSAAQGGGKACKNSRMMVVLPPDGDANTPLWTLSTSPTANKGFDGYVNSVARMFQMPPVGVVTTVGFDENETFVKLVFSDPQPNPNVNDHFARQEEAKAMLAAEPDVSGFVSKSARAPARGKVAARR